MGEWVVYATRHKPLERPSEDQRKFLELFEISGNETTPRLWRSEGGTKRACQVRGWVEWRCLDDLV